MRVVITARHKRSTAARRATGGEPLYSHDRVRRNLAPPGCAHQAARIAAVAVRSTTGDPPTPLAGRSAGPERLEEGQLTFCMGAPQHVFGAGEVFPHFGHLYWSAIRFHPLFFPLRSADHVGCHASPQCNGESARTGAESTRFSRASFQQGQRAGRAERPFGLGVDEAGAVGAA